MILLTRVMQSQMTGNFPLAVQMFLNCLGYFPIAFLLIPDDLFREYFRKKRPVHIPLAFWNLRNVLMLPEMIDELVREFFLSQDCLAPHLRPDRLFPDAPLNELLVVFLGLSPLPAEFWSKR